MQYKELKSCALMEEQIIRISKSKNTDPKFTAYFIEKFSITDIFPRRILILKSSFVTECREPYKCFSKVKYFECHVRRRQRFGANKLSAT